MTPRPDLGQRLASTRRVVENDWLSLHHDEVVDDAGRRSDYWVVRRPSFVLVVPRRRDGDRLGLVRRFRYPVGLWFWEFPQRRLAASSPDDVEATASQLAHEALGGAGLRVERLELIGRFFEAYGFSDHQCYCYLAEVDGGSAGPDMRWEAAPALVERLAASGIADSASLAALGLLLAHDRQAAA